MPSNFRRNGLFTALVTAVCTAIFTGVFTGLFMGRPARAQPVAPTLSAEAQASFEPLRNRSIIGEALGRGGPGLWLLGTTSGVASVVTEIHGPPKTNPRGWTNASIATMGVARVSTTTGSAPLVQQIGACDAVEPGPLPAGRRRSRAAKTA